MKDKIVYFQDGKRKEISTKKIVVITFIIAMMFIIAGIIIGLITAGIILYFQN